jgi:N-acetylneuraminic acid mutarotase
MLVLAAVFALVAGTANAVPATAQVSAPQAPQAQPDPLKPEVQRAVKHDVLPSLRNVRPSAQTNTKTASVLPRHDVPKPKKSTTSTSTGKVQSANVTNSMPSFDKNFEGVGNVNGVLPPDAQGDVGPNNYVQMINLSFAIYDKQGNKLLGPLPNTTLWQGMGTPCSTVNGGDAVTMYDESADRWFMSQLAYPGGAQGFHQCIAISATPDPTGAWYRYDFLFSSTTLNDYPKFGIWPDGYYASHNEFLNGATFTGVTVQAYNRDAMLAGQDASVVSFHVGDSSGKYGGLLPSDAEGSALGFSPPSGAPEPFVMMDDDAWGFSPTDRLLMWDFHVDWATPANSTFGVNGAPNRFFETQPFDSNLCNYARSCIKQPGTSVGLDTLADRLMYRAAYRNLGNKQSIALTQSVDVDNTDHAGVRWYQLDNPGSGWSLADQGTYAPDGDSRWMGSAAMDASGDLAVGFSASSATTFPSIRAAGRLAGDPAGQLAQGESQLIAGGGSQTHSLSRWGDYAALQVDPTDGCTFWFTTEYIPTTTSADWHTRIGSFKFPSCTAGPHGTLTGAVTDSATGSPIADATVSTSVASTTTDAQGHYALTLAAGTYDVTFGAFGYATQTANGVVISDGGTTTKNAALVASPSVTVSGNVTDGSGHGWPMYTRIEVNGKPGGPVYTDPKTGHYSVSLPQGADYTVKFTAQLPGYEVKSDTISVGTSNVTHDVALHVLSSCAAPGYHLVNTAALTEDFDSGTLPAGWNVTDAIGAGEKWLFQDLNNRGNLTGGTGSMAIMDSDRLGSGHTQDTSLVTPAVDLSSASHPVVMFNEDYLQWSADKAVDVDVSIDGGTTWQNAFHNLTSRRGPRVNTVAIPQAANQSNVKVRWRYNTTFGYWWEVDNAFVGNQSCDPIPGGLVVGNVTDVDTQAGLNGATVVSNDKAIDKGTTVATPDDPNNPDGYYWLFSTLTGTHGFTASKSKYESKSQDVNVAADGTTRADYTLGAGHLSITPTSVDKSIVLGGTGSANVHIANTGSGAAQVQVGERKGAFQILTSQGARLQRIKVEDEEDLNPAGWLGDHEDEHVPGIDAGQPAEPTWSQIANYPTGIMDNAADAIEGKTYSVGGYNGSANVASGAVYDPDTDSWSAIANMANTREKPGAGAIDGTLYVTGGWDDAGNPAAATEAYDPAGNSWETVAPNPAPRAAPGSAVADGKFYQVGGCTNATCAPSDTNVAYDPSSNSWATLAPYPHQVSWMSCGGVDGKVYCAGGFSSGTAYTDAYVYDPGANAWSRVADMPANLWGASYAAANGMLLISSGLSGSSTLTNAGYAYDPGSDSWTNLPNAQFPRFRGAAACGFTKVGGSSIAGFSPTAQSERLSEFDQCGATDVPWLAETPTDFTLQPGASVDVAVKLSATKAAGVTQPGAYTAQLVLKHNTPDTIQPINVTMNVTPPTGWGKIAGAVTGTSCKGMTAPLRGAIVQADGKTYHFSLSTEANGSYAFWAPAASNPFTLIASKDGWVPQTTTLNVKSGKSVTANFALRQVGC